MTVLLRTRTWHKYHAVPITVDGIRFASTKEGTRYRELRLLARAGEIWELELQPVFPLQVPVPGGCAQWVGNYVADFSYQTREGRVVEDVKGVKTPLYRWKKKHVEAQYGIRIIEL